MDPAKAACDLVTTCWDCTANYRKYVRSLGDNLAGLESKTGELRGVYKDVKRLVVRAEGERWIRKGDPARWLRTVKDLREEASRVVVDGRQMMLKSCLCGICFVNCRARYHQSKLAEVKRAELETELARGRDFKAKKDVAYEPADLILERSLGKLRDKRDELRDVFETVKLRVVKEEEGHLVRTPEVDGWLKRVGDLLLPENEVLEILKQGREELEKVSRHGEGDDPQSQRNSQSYYVISKRAAEKSLMLREKLIQSRGFTVLTCKPVDPPIVEMPLECHVGAESTFQEVWDWVCDEKVKRIGLLGMGGVGKTTLLKRLHNQFLQVSHDYDFVVWVVVSKQIDVDKIQKAILEKLKVKAEDLDTTGRAARIWSYLKDKNFLLFLDDLWDPIDLVEHVGVPSCDGPKKQKIIFTTREDRVCNGMKADRRTRVECLQLKDALELFHKNLGDRTWRAHQRIPVIAKRLVHECKYLPLAIKTVARAMVGVMELKRWMDAEDDMKNRLSKFQDIEKEVLVRLEFSYDRLPDEAHRKCFLYLSIFPEDYEILQDDAIDLWIGEGFLDECAHVHDARDKGEEILRRLKDTCLVEFVEGVNDMPKRPRDYVKMHDVVREMALWVCSKLGQKSNTEPLRLKELKKWKDADRIYLQELTFTLQDSLATITFPHLSTLIIDYSYGELLLDFFSSMPCLRVLELSDILISVFPSSIWNLRNLRYLKIIFPVTKLVEVPVEIKNLTNLEVLILPPDVYPPPEALSALSSLRVFRLLLDNRDLSNIDELEFLDALERMESLEELSIGLSEGAEKLLGSPKLSSLLRELVLHNSSGLDILRMSKLLLRRLENLQSMSFRKCPNLERIDISCEDDGLEGTCSNAEYLGPPLKPSWFSCGYCLRSLVYVEIQSCDHLVNVTSLIYHAPLLETLYIEECSSLEELIVDDVEDDQVINSGLFSSLKYLFLRFLGSLRSICRRTLPFPSLKKITVYMCPELEKLPLNNNSAKDSLQVIEGEKEWWEGLQWDDPIAKQLFAKFFIDPRVPRIFSKSTFLGPMMMIPGEKRIRDEAYGQFRIRDEEYGQFRIRDEEYGQFPISDEESSACRIV